MLQSRTSSNASSDNTSNCTEVQLPLLVPPIKLWRKANLSDIPKIRILNVTTGEHIFGEFKLDELLETSPISMIMENETEQIIGYISCENHPNISAIDISTWYDWINRHYKCTDITYENIIFIHLLLWDPRYPIDEIVKHFFSSIFMNYVKLDYICLIRYSAFQFTKYDERLLRKYFTKILPLGQKDVKPTQYLNICGRNKIVPKLKIRRAVAEDNDDLVEILNLTCKTLKERYHEFYIAEIILNLKSTRRIIVAEHQNFAVGLLCVNSEVSISEIYCNFELEPFHGLRKFSENELIEFSSNESLPNEQFSSDKTTNNLNRKDLTWISSLTMFNDNQPLIIDSVISNNSFSQVSMTSFMKALVSSNTSSETSSTIDQMSDGEHQQMIEGISEDNQQMFRISNVPMISLNERITESNVFTIELYGIHSNFDDRLAYDMLEAVFDIFADREYCLISLPTILRTFPLLKYFVKVIPRPVSCYDQDVFILHRNSILSTLTLRIATEWDMNRLERLVRRLQKSKMICDDFLTSIWLYQEQIQITQYPIVILSETEIIGFCILDTFLATDYLRVNYDLDFYYNFKFKEAPENHCLIKQFILSPLFRPRTTFIFNELTRLTGFTCFYYFLHQNPRVDRSTISILPEMYPIRPRKRMLYFLDKLKENSPPEYITRTPPNYRLYHTNTKICQNLKTLVNTKIIVIGQSTVAMSFLETLIYDASSRNLWFSNITLVSPHGLPSNSFEDDPNLSLLFPFDGTYSADYLNRLGLRTWINIVYGHLTKIDRTHKYVIIDNEQRLKYDNLYLFCGLQYNIPTIKRKTKTVCPKNLILLNNTNDAEIFSTKLKIIQTKLTIHTPIIIYGNTIDSYCCLNYLLSCGISGNLITFIHITTVYGNEFYVPTFNDEFIEKTIDEQINQLGVTVFTDCTLTNWETDENNFIRKLFFESKFKIIQQDCSLFICFAKKCVNTKTLLAFYNSELVFDGRLVIDENYRTNDECIYAGGTLTKYQRILYANQYKQEYFSSIEIGRDYGRKLIKRLDPNLPYHNQNDQSTRRDDDTEPSVPKFKEPIIVSCVLPGHLNCLIIRTPGLQISHQNSKALDNYGLDIITGDCKNKENEIKYFRIHINEYNLVTAIICLTQNLIPVQNLINIWGKHVNLLNNLIIRYETNMIHDLYDYFTESWCYAIFHDRFNLLQERNQLIFRRMWENDNEMKICIEKRCPDDSTPQKGVRFLINGEEYHQSSSPSSSTMNTITARYQKEIEQNLMEFLEVNKDELPMYLNRIYGDGLGSLNGLTIDGR